MSSVALEYPACPLCGSEARRQKFARLPDILHRTPGLFGVVTCRGCRADYLYPRPNAEARPSSYPDSYEPWQSAPLQQAPGPRTYRLVRFLSERLYSMRFGSTDIEITPFGNRRLLDVGCGAGQFLLSMQRRGWDVFGVETGASAARLAGQRAGPDRIHHGTLESLDPGISNFQLINFSHVLEHLTDPADALRQARSRLATEGRIRILLPDASGLEARIFGRYWLGLDVPRHSVMFSRKRLQTLLESEGYQVLSVRPQFAPEIPRMSLHYWVDQGVPPSMRWLARPLIRPALTLAMLSYAFGYIGAIDVRAVTVLR